MAKEETKKPESTEAPATATATAEAPMTDPMALSIGDLKNLSTILDVASKRGAFGAGEMSTVGMLFNKLQGFLAKVAPEQKPGMVAPPTVAPTAGKQ